MYGIPTLVLCNRELAAADTSLPPSFLLMHTNPHLLEGNVTYRELPNIPPHVKIRMIFFVLKLTWVRLCGDGGDQLLGELQSVDPKKHTI